jgi:outer membrane lipoprotein SlyB
MKTSHAIVAAAITSLTFLSGCAGPSQQDSTSPYPAAGSSYSANYGVVNSIQISSRSQSQNPGLGAVVGGVVGGVLGHQVGGGTGKDVATVAGVVGGAVVGNQIEQRNRAQAPDLYLISVRLDNGSYQTVQQDSLGDLQVGSRVRIDNGRAYRY